VTPPATPGAALPWRRNFFAVWPSLFAVSTGLMAVIPMLPPYIEERFAIEDPVLVRRWAGVIYAAGPLASALVGPLWGALGDRVGRKIMVVRAVIAITVVMALMPLAPSPSWLAVMRLVQGSFAGYVAPAIALVSAGVPAGEQGKVLARLQIGLALGLLAGPPLGAEVAAWFGRSSVFYFTSAMSAAGLLPLLFFARDDRTTMAARSERSLIRAMGGDFGYLARNRVFATLLLLVFLLRFGVNMLEPYLALWVRELGPLPWFTAHSRDLGHALDRTTGAAFTILAVAQIVVAPVWGRLADRKGPLRCLIVVSLALSAVLSATAFVRTIEQFLPLRCVAAVFMAGSMTLTYAAVSKRVEPARRSLAFAMVQSGTQFGLSLGPVTGGFIAQGAGVRTLFLFAGAVLFVTGVSMWFIRGLPVRAAAIPARPVPDTESG
jgi:DHA1 family multidrug resistance protein-like MFS transporter